MFNNQTNTLVRNKFLNTQGRTAFSIVLRARASRYLFQCLFDSGLEMESFKKWNALPSSFSVYDYRTDKTEEKVSRRSRTGTSFRSAPVHFEPCFDSVAVNCQDGVFNQITRFSCIFPIK